MTKPCLPYTGQFLVNIERSKELYKDHKGFVSTGATGNYVEFKPKEYRHEQGK